MRVCEVSTIGWLYASFGRLTGGDSTAHGRLTLMMFQVPTSSYGAGRMARSSLRAMPRLDDRGVVSVIWRELASSLPRPQSSTPGGRVRCRWNRLFCPPSPHFRDSPLEKKSSKTINTASLGVVAFLRWPISHVRSVGNCKDRNTANPVMAAELR